MKKKKNKTSSNCIARNKKAGHNYVLSEHVEAGISLQGWETKSLRQGRASLTDAYCVIKGDEIFLVGCSISPLPTATAYIETNPERYKKLLLKRKEINKLKDLVEKQGFSIPALELYWSGAWAKVKIAIGKGKQNHDKRESDRERTWNIEKSRALKNS